MISLISSNTSAIGHCLCKKRRPCGVLASQPATQFPCVSRRSLVAQALHRPEPPSEDDGERRAPSLLRVAWAAAAGVSAWLAAAGTALADPDAGAPSVMGPPPEALLEAGPEFSFVNLLFFALCSYWIIKSVMYFLQTPPPDSADDKTDPAGRGRGKEQDEQQGGSFGSLRETGRAPIRSVVDSSKPTPGSGLDEKAAKCANLARSAAYRVMSTVRESQPRIHALVEELGGAPHAERPHHADIDTVAAMVYERVLRERGAKGADDVLCPRERAQLEVRLLEEVAERCAAEQVARFAEMAARGELGGAKAGKKEQEKQKQHSH